MECVPEVNSFIYAEAVADLPLIPNAEAGKNFCLFACVLDCE